MKGIIPDGLKQKQGGLGGSVGKRKHNACRPNDQGSLLAHLELFSIFPTLLCDPRGWPPQIISSSLASSHVQPTGLTSRIRGQEE